MERPCRALCMVEWFKVFSCSEVKCPCCFTDTPLMAAPQLIQTLLTDMVLECQTCRKDIRGVEYITHQCSGEPTKAEVQTASGVLRRLASTSYQSITIHTGGIVKHIIVLRHQNTTLGIISPSHHPSTHPYQDQNPALSTDA